MSREPCCEHVGPPAEAKIPRHESLTKFGFRYVAAEDWGRLHRLFRRALELKLLGGGLASLILLLLAPFAAAGNPF